MSFEKEPSISARVGYGSSGYLLAAPATLVIALVSVAVYVAQRLSGTWHSYPNVIDNVWHLLGYHRSAVLDGEIWRVFTPNLIHTVSGSVGPPGLGHLIFNMLTLLAFGPKVEQLFGWRRFLVLYVACGSVAYGWLVLAKPPGQGPYAYAGGASGAIFGVLGALLVVLWARRRIRTERALRAALLAYILIQIYVAMATSVGGSTITREIHAGGFLAGIAIGAMAVRRQRRTPAVSSTVGPRCS